MGADEIVEHVRTAKNGDKSSLEALYRHYHDTLLRFILGNGFQKQDADDICQTVFIKVFEKIAIFNIREITEVTEFEARGKTNSDRVEGRFRAFLYRVAIWKMHDFWRKKKTREEIFPISLDSDASGNLHETISTGDLPIDEQVERTEKVRILRDLMAVLSWKERVIVILRYWDSATYEEIARVFLPEEVSKMRHQREIANLRQMCRRACKKLNNLIQESSQYQEAFKL